jgi:hypothetical protein
VTIFGVIVTFSILIVTFIAIIVTFPEVIVTMVQFDQSQPHYLSLVAKPPLSKKHQKTPPQVKT